MTEFESLVVPGPIPNNVSRPFWDAASEGRCTLQRCDTCVAWIFYPRTHCPQCWSPWLAWHEASGRGTVKSFSAIHRPGHPGWTAAVPYIVALIELEEGPTMLSTLVDSALDSVRVGMRVAVRFVQVGKFALPMFAPLQQSTKEADRVD